MGGRSDVVGVSSSLEAGASMGCWGQGTVWLGQRDDRGRDLGAPFFRALLPSQKFLLFCKRGTMWLCHE